MDDGSLRPASDFSGKSSDYQLAEAFNAPGFRNEFLAREALTVLTKLSTDGRLGETYRSKLDMLIETRPSLADDDPVAEMIDLLMSAAERVES
jgi:hypothetical protein